MIQRRRCQVRQIGASVPRPPPRYAQVHFWCQFGVFVRTAVGSPAQSNVASRRRARRSLRFTTVMRAWSCNRPRTTARADPPAPNTTTSRFATSIPSSRTVARNPGRSVLKPRRRSRQMTVFTAAMSLAAASDLLNQGGNVLLVRNGHVEASQCGASKRKPARKVARCDTCRFVRGINASMAEGGGVHRRRKCMVDGVTDDGVPLRGRQYHLPVLPGSAGNRATR